MPDTSTCPRTNSEGDRFKRLVWKNHDSQNDPHLSTRDGTIIPKRSPYVELKKNYMNGDMETEHYELARTLYNTTSVNIAEKAPSSLVFLRGKEENFGSRAAPGCQ
ncbi:hypothetical protein E2C01_036004 [Portunus trituberculatus]|uniref:Uncharacterized protein n=1 Tax=Portunus trituberculatus TaxID=210409 RepID=A0A5B7FB94_PORTR|nr:hypothetical protein [Portunus trituberculatus]